MTWALAAALAAGITGDSRVAAGALVFCVVRGAKRPRSGLSAVVSALVLGLFALYGALGIQGLKTGTAKFDEMATGGDRLLSLEGVVASFPAYRYGGMAFDLQTRIEGVESSVRVRSREYVVSYGDSVLVTGTIYRPKPESRAGYRRYLFGGGVCGEVRAQPGGVVRLPGHGGRAASREFFWPIHDRLRRVANRSIGSRCGIAIALLLGERGYLERGTRKAFVRLGISHLLALSGLHLGFVAAAILMALRVVGRRNGWVLVGCLVVYVGVVGPIVSLYRALAMAVVLVVASGVRRPIDPVRALAVAFVVVLLFMPHAFYSVGFQLSFLATLGVLLQVRGMTPPEPGSWMSRAWFWLRSSLLVSIAAQAAVAPLVLGYFGRMSLLSPFGTLLFVVPVGGLLVGLSCAALVSLAAPPLEPHVFGALGWVLDIFRGILVAASEAAPEPITLSAPDPWLYYVGVGLIYVRRWGWMGKAAGLCAIAGSVAFTSM